MDWHHFIRWQQFWVVRCHYRPFNRDAERSGGVRQFIESTMTGRPDAEREVAGGQFGRGQFARGQRSPPEFAEQGWTQMESQLQRISSGSRLN